MNSDKLVSILMLTIDRYEITKRCLEHNLATSNIDLSKIELLVCDNGSKDQRIIDFIKAQSLLKYHRLNKVNEGVASSFNQLLIRATGKHICLLGNDILMPSDWLAEMVRYAEAVPGSGLIGLQCTEALPPLSSYHGIIGHYVDKKIDRVFGTWVFRRELLDLVGGFCEEFNPYGLEDSDYNNRVNFMGLKSLYVPNKRSEHIGNDVGQSSEYRKMKDKSLSKNTEVYMRRVREYGVKGLFESLPQLKEPLC